MRSVTGSVRSLVVSFVFKEIHSVLLVALKRNHILQAVNAKRQLLNGWRQVIEVLMTACPVDLLDGDIRRSFILEVIQELLLKVSWREGIACTILSRYRNLFHGFRHGKVFVKGHDIIVL